MPTTRRNFCLRAPALLLSPHLLAQSTSHPNVALIDHDRILRAADTALAQPPTPITTIPAPQSPGTLHDFYSTDTFPAHRDALLQLGIQVPALTAAYTLTHNQRYATQAAEHLKAWFITPNTRMTPSLTYAHTIPTAPTSTQTARNEGITQAVPLSEIVQSISFLTSSDSLTLEDHKTLHQWFNDYALWLNTSRQAGLARDDKSHHATAWLLQAAAIARLSPANEAALTELRQRFKTSTLRTQISYEGLFPHELTTPAPYRNSLFNLDMLTAICLLLSTPFESLWNYDLQDGPGIRPAIARHVPYIADRGRWPYPADTEHFKDLPLRRPALLFAARAYNRPEYADLWQTLPADTTIPDLQQTFPIRQPLLWITQPRP